MHCFYALKSLKDGKLYKGVTDNIGRRLKEHNSGKTKSTRNRGPFIVVYIEEFDNKITALKKEKYYKSYPGGLKLRERINRQA
jgi:putative endonuclease